MYIQFIEEEYVCYKYQLTKHTRNYFNVEIIYHTLEKFLNPQKTFTNIITVE